MSEITTYAGPYDIYSLTIEYGKIIRVTCITIGSAFCHVLESEFFQLEHFVRKVGKKRYMLWNDSRCEIHLYNPEDFEIIVKDSILQTAYHNLERLKDIYDLLKEGDHKDYCRTVQQHMKKLLDW